MSAKELSTLRAGVESKPGTESTIAVGTGESQMPHIPEELSILPVRGLVIFPGTIIPLTIQRAASLKLLDDTLPRTKVIGLLTQRDEAKDDPTPQDLYTVGTAALVLKLLRQAEDNVLVIVQGLRRFSLRKIVATSPFLRAEVDLPESIMPAPSKEWEATFRNLRDSAARLFELAPDAPEQARLMILNIESPEQLADFLAPNLNVDVAQKQALLEELDVEKRVRAVQKQISAQLEIAEIQQKLQKDVASQFSDAQRRAYLRSQIKAIQRELGEAEGGGEEQAQQLRARLEEAKPPEEVMKQAERELKRLDFIPPASPEFSVIVSYIEIIADLPWNKLSQDNLDLDQAQKDSRPRSLRSGKSKKAADRIPGRAQTQSTGPRRDPLFSGAAWRGKNQSRSINRRRAGPKICPDQPRRYARRGGNPRTSSHVHRLDAGTYHSGAAPLRHPQSGFHAR